MTKNWNFGYDKGNIMSWTPLKPPVLPCLPLFGFTNHIWFTFAGKIQGFRPLNGLKCPKTAIFGAPTTQKKVFALLNLV